MAPRILIVDRNEAFAIMLEQMLLAEGGCEVQVAQGTQDALSILRRMDFDLTILDMDLSSERMSYQDLIQAVREVRPAMRLMLIPLMGEDLPPEVSQLDIQGTLSKPFFADDLLPGIADALARQVSSPHPPSGVQPKPTRPPVSVPAGGAIPQIQAVLSELARETTADTALLLSIQAGGARVVAHVGEPNAGHRRSGLPSAQARGAPQAGALADLILATIQAAQAVAQFLGPPDVPFEHNMFEGGVWRLYVLAVRPGLWLAVITPLSTPLGTIRHNLRRAGRDLAGLALT